MTNSDSKSGETFRKMVQSKMLLGPVFDKSFVAKVSCPATGTSHCGLAPPGMSYSVQRGFRAAPNLERPCQPWQPNQPANQFPHAKEQWTAIECLECRMMLGGCRLLLDEVGVGQDSDWGR